MCILMGFLGVESWKGGGVFQYLQGKYCAPVLGVRCIKFEAYESIKLFE